MSYRGDLRGDRVSNPVSSRVVLVGGVAPLAGVDVSVGEVPTDKGSVVALVGVADALGGVL